MADFDILQLSFLLSLSNQNLSYLTDAINWELASTSQICTKVKKVESVCQIINTHFNFKTRPWQVGIIIDITKYKRYICAISGINVIKSLIYQSILVITRGFELVIFFIIAFMKDQVCITPKMLYNYHLYLIVWFHIPDWFSYCCAYLKYSNWRS